MEKHLQILLIIKKKLDLWLKNLFKVSFKCVTLLYSIVSLNESGNLSWFFLCVLPQGTKEENIQYLNNPGKRYLQNEANSSAMVADSFTDWLG